MKFSRKHEEKGGKFHYKRLTPGYMQERRNQSGSDRDPYVSPNVKLFPPASGDNTIRILPATWEEGKYGLDVFVHYGIGSDRSTYLCLKAMKDKPCPVCEERGRAEKEGDDDYAQALRTSKRVGVYVIDRDKEGDGPKLWLMPFTLEREIAAQAINKKTGEVLQFIDPEEGYDLNFEKKGKEKQTKYIGVSFDRDPTPLSEDEDTAEKWMENITENPIPDVLVFQKYSDIQKQFEGASDSSKDEDDRRGRKWPSKLRLGDSKKKRRRLPVVSE